MPYLSHLTTALRKMEKKSDTLRRKLFWKRLYELQNLEKKFPKEMSCQELMNWPATELSAFPCIAKNVVQHKYCKIGFQKTVTNVSRHTTASLSSNTGLNKLLKYQSSLLFMYYLRSVCSKFRRILGINFSSFKCNSCTILHGKPYLTWLLQT